MRVVQIINGLGRGGGERVLVDIVAGLVPRGYDLRVYCLTRSGPLADELGALGVPVRRLTWVGLPRPSAFVRLALDLRHAEVVHSHFFYSDLVAAVLAPVTGVRRRLSTRHETGSWMTALHRGLESWVYRGCERVLCVSDGVAESLRVRGLAPTQLRTLYPALPELEPDPALLPTLTGRSIVSVGRLERVKGHDLLIDAFARLSQEPGMADVGLLIAGDGRERRALERQARAAGLSARVHFLGELSPPAVAALLSQAAVFVLPSRDEAFGISLVEAMRAGLPCIATRVGGVPEILGDPQHGVLVPPGDASALASALRQVLTEPDRAARFGGAARRYVEQQFSRESFTRQMAEIYSTGLQEVVA